MCLRDVSIFLCLSVEALKAAKYFDTDFLSACRGSSSRRKFANLFRTNDAYSHLGRKENGEALPRLV